MADIDKRLKYYNGQFLREQDFTAEQEYHLDRMRRHAGQLHTPGIADGLNVTATVGAVSAVVTPGTALDREGRQIFLREPYNVAFESSHSGQWVLVVIAYAQEPADEATVGDVGMTRWLERPEVTVVLESGAPPPDVRIRLARLRIAGNGTIAEHDSTVRTPAGARVRPHETFESLRLSRQGVGSNQWPVLTSGAASRADLAGSLSVTGNIAVTGTVDGRDISADGALLDTLAAAQIEGVSNPGGNIDLVGANGITIAGNNTAKTITISGGSPLSIDGVSNAGGNIDLIAGGSITISPDDGNNRITISETHSALIGNPHGTLASQLADYDFKSVFTDDVYFNEGWGSGSTQTINVGFAPKLIIVTGFIQGRFSGQWVGSPIFGIARVTGSGIVQNGCGPSAKRDSTAPGMFQSGVEAAGVIAYCRFTSNVTPTFNYESSVSISSVASNSVTFMHHPWNTSISNWFDIQIRFTCFGN